MRSALRAGWVCLLYFCFAGLAGCASSCGAQRQVVAVDVFDDADASTLVDMASAEVLAKEGASRLPGFSVALGATSGERWQLSVRFRLATERREADGKVRRALGASATLVRLGDGEGPEQLSAEAMEADSFEAGASAAPLLETLMTELSRRLATSARLSGADPKALEAAIGSDDEHARAVAIAMVADRKMPALRPKLEGLLTSGDIGPREAMRVAGALVKLGQPSSGAALIEAISRWPELTVPLIFSLSRLGGSEAAGYLFTVSSGHEVPQVREAAAEALRELERKAQGAHP